MTVNPQSLSALFDALARDFHQELASNATKSQPEPLQAMPAPPQLSRWQLLEID